MRGRFEDLAHAAELAIMHNRHVRAADPRLGALPTALLLGPRPAGEALATLDSFLTEQPAPIPLAHRALFLAMLDRFDEALPLIEQAGNRLRELGQSQYSAWFLGGVAYLAGDYETTATHLEEWCAYLEATGTTAALSGHAPELGRVLCRLARFDEAERLAGHGRELADSDDTMAQALWRQVQALVHTQHGAYDEAERLAREAVVWTERSDALRWQGDALSDLAQVLEAAGRPDEAIAAWREALDRYERKEVIPLARRVRERLATLEPV
jgi:tetratricopeptide (TPR) repeat protein